VQTIADHSDRLAPRELARPRILMEAGMTDSARGEIQRLSRRARSLSERLELAHLSSDVGDYHRAQRLIVDRYSETLARGPVRRQEELWWYAWPSAYSDLVDEATSQPGSVDPELVYSIMREESGYRAAVVSPVGARGLLQIMTTTGERLARSTGLKSFQADDLFEPRTNIGLGSYYLGELSKRFDGRLSASIASYNAGPEAVSEWTPKPQANDDEWVESIPYDQTRSYVKRVLRSLHAYRILY
jgi:soluble lytic murein transglycosylase